MTANELIERYNIIRKDDKILIRDSERAYSDGTVEELKNRKSEILARLIEMKNEEKEVFEDRQRKISEIEGLAEIKAAITDVTSWYKELDKSFDDVGGMGVRARPNHDITAMLAKYPRAAAYLKAEEQAEKHNVELAEIGAKALEKIIYKPNDYEEAIEVMNEEIEKFVERHMFD